LNRFKLFFKKTEENCYFNKVIQNHKIDLRIMTIMAEAEKCRICGVEISHDRMQENDKLCIKCFREKETTYD